MGMVASPQGTSGDEWVDALVARAYRAARRGRIEELELALARLRAIGPVDIGEVEIQLHGIARAARAHPSYRPAPEKSRRAAG